jgi:outer membrane protein assembly factor BamD
MRKTALFVLLTALILVSAGISGCDPYRKLAKSNKIADKDSAAIGYYNQKKYDRAVYLFEELVPIYSGTLRAEEMYFYYAYCRFYLGELVSASYYFEDYAKKYPNSSHAQEFEYMTAKTYHMLSDPHYLDQKYTYKAIEYYQLFLSRHPYSEYTEKCMAALRELRERLAKKAYEQAYLYYKIGYNKAAVVAFENMVNQFPDSEFREQAQYYMLKAAVMLAAQSTEGKRSERYDEAMEIAERFTDRFPDSKFASNVADLKSGIGRDKSAFEADMAQKAQSDLYERVKNALMAAKDAQDDETVEMNRKKAANSLEELRKKYPDGKFTAQAEKMFDKFEALKDER